MSVFRAYISSLEVQKLCRRNLVFRIYTKSYMTNFIFVLTCYVKTLLYIMTKLNFIFLKNGST
jgi:hypothetical protein